MAILNAQAREIEAKLVYYGTALGGKTTNLRVLHRLAEPEQRQKLVSLNTAGDRTLFFDLLPFDLGRVLDWRVRLKLYSIPGQPEYSETRRVVLKASDGIVFVADSALARHAENRLSIGFLRTNLKQNQIDAERIPIVFQWNKRDLPDPIPEADLERDLNWRRAPAVSAVAMRGEGVLETFEAASVELLGALLERYGPRGLAVATVEQLRAIVHRKLESLFARCREWDASRPACEEPSPRHVVVRSDLARALIPERAPAPQTSPWPVEAQAGAAALAEPVAAERVLDTGQRLEAALDNEIQLLNQIMDREAAARLSGPEAESDAAIESAFGSPWLIPGIDPERLRSALAEASAAPGFEGAAAPLLRLACELSEADAGSVLVMSVGAGPLAEVARQGLAKEPLNQPDRDGATAPARALAFGSSSLWGDDLRRFISSEPAGLQVGRMPIAALPLVAGHRRVGLLVLHAAAGANLASPVRAALELIAATLALGLIIRGLERKLASSPPSPSLPAPQTCALAPPLAAVAD